MATPVRDQYAGVETYIRRLYADDGYTEVGVVTNRGLRYTTWSFASVTQYEVRQLDTLFTISRQFYGSDALWWCIADANPDLLNPLFDLQVGQLIVVPRLNA